jgi:hypothetical protein
MLSLFYEGVAYVYGIFQFIGFGRSPLLDVQDKYTEPNVSSSPVITPRIIDIQTEVDPVEYLFV